MLFFCCGVSSLDRASQGNVLPDFEVQVSLCKKVSNADVDIIITQLLQNVKRSVIPSEVFQIAFAVVWPDGTTGVQSVTQGIDIEVPLVSPGDRIEIAVLCSRSALFAIVAGDLQVKRKLVGKKEAVACRNGITLYTVCNTLSVVVQVAYGIIAVLLLVSCGEAQ